MFKKDKKIEFVSFKKGIEEIDECLPKKASSFIPSWWKKMPANPPYPELQTVKMCPALPDFFSEGFILPMWSDTKLKHNPSTGNWEWICGRPDYDTKFNIDVHPNEQFLDYSQPHLNGVPGSIVFKLYCPWRIITPKGYSVLQLPLLYHFNNDFSVLPGIIDTDRHHYVNQQVLYHGNGKEIFIKRGTPLVQYIPFKREKVQLDVRYKNYKDDEKMSILDTKLSSIFPGRGAYRRMRKE